MKRCLNSDDEPQARSRRSTPCFRLLCFSLNLILIICCLCQKTSANEITTRHVRQSMGLGIQYLLQQQKADGSFPADEVLTHPVGVTCVASIALNGTGVSESAPAIKRALNFLRSAGEQQLPTHELALLLIALIDAGETEDLPLINSLITDLQQRQAEDGSWWHQTGNVENGLRISYLAVLALRDAALAGYPVSADVWKRVQNYWRATQNQDGSWGTIIDRPMLLQENSHLSLAGRTRQALSTLALCQEMLELAKRKIGAEVDCCSELPVDSARQRGQLWLDQEIARWKPEQKSQSFLQYHLYALEKTGQAMSGQLADEQDWYLSGTRTLLIQQNRRVGYWEGNNRILATSYSLLFLSKALKPVLAQKWVLGSSSSSSYDQTQRAGSTNPSPPISEIQLPATQERHPQDLVRLTSWLTTLPDWPQQLHSQEVQLRGKTIEQGLLQLQQAPVLYLTGTKRPEVSHEEVQILRLYLQQGGILIASPACQSAEFELGFYELVEKLDPGGSGLVPLGGNHPVYWVEFALEPENWEIWGVDSGCRTSIFYSPQDLGCQWNQANPTKTRTASINSSTENETSETSTKKSDSAEAKNRSELALQTGANLLAYATAKNVTNRFEVVAAVDQPELQTKSVPRGAFLVAELSQATSQANSATNPPSLSDSASLKIRPSGALEKMAQAAASSAEITVSVHPQKVSIQDTELFMFPVLYLHGHQALEYSRDEKRLLKQYLDRGGVLFCDACCGSAAFDRSFRSLMKELYPAESLSTIPAQCELFTEQIGHALQEVEFHRWNYDTQARRVVSQTEQIPPALEGIQRNGMYFVFYSRYDLGCALESVSRTSCEGYTPTSAAKIATNVLLYSLLQ